MNDLREEIEEMISSVKQVFLYFLDKPCPPSEYSSDYENVRKFKKRCNDRGLYKVVSDERELSEKFYEDLTQHFVEILNGEKNPFKIHSEECGIYIRPGRGILGELRYMHRETG